MRYIGYFFLGLGVIIAVFWCLFAFIGVIVFAVTAGHTGLPSWAYIVMVIPWLVAIVLAITMWGEELWEDKR